MFALRSTYVAHVVWYHPSRTFLVLLYVLWLVTITVVMWSCYSNPKPSFKNRKINQKKNENRNKNENELSPLLLSLINSLARKVKE